MKDIYENHPKWKELEFLCSEIEKLKMKAQRLREEINNDLFVPHDEEVKA
jgi:hypothetical protein